MGGGNAQKSATARDRKLKEAAGKGAGKPTFSFAG